MIILHLFLLFHQTNLYVAFGFKGICQGGTSNIYTENLFIFSSAFKSVDPRRNGIKTSNLVQNSLLHDTKLDRKQLSLISEVNVYIYNLIGNFPVI